jgi:hypothetical protein
VEGNPDRRVSEVGRRLRTYVAACSIALAPTLAHAESPRPVEAATAVTGYSLNGLGSLRARALSSLAPAHVHPASQVADAPAAEPAPSAPPRLTQAYACLIGGTIGTAAAFGAGAENLVNTIAGGIVPTANRGVLLLGIAGIVFASFCGIGQAIAPVYLYYTEPEPPPPSDAGARRVPEQHAGATGITATHVNFQSGVLGERASGAARAIAQRPAREDFRR